MNEQSNGLRWEIGMSDEERRIQIMRSLTGILRDRHLSSLTMQDIALRLGMTKGNLYNYFRSKQELLYECHTKAMENSLALLDTARAASPTASGQLRALMMALAHSVVNDPYGAVITTDLDSLSPQQRRHYLTLRDRFEQGLRDIVADGMGSGEFIPADVKLTSFALLGSFQWISRWYRADGPSGPEEIGALFADLFLRALSI